MCQKSQNATHKLLSMIPYPPKRSLKVATFFFILSYLDVKLFYTTLVWGQIVTTFCMTPFWPKKTKLWAQNKKIYQNFLKYHIYFRNWTQRSLQHNVKFWQAFKRLRPSTLLQIKCWPKVIFKSTQMYTLTHVIMKYVCTPTNPVNPHGLLGGIVIMMVLYGMQSAA